MNDAKITVKTALSFVLVVVLIVATLFGIEVPYDWNDVSQETAQEVVVTDQNTDKESTPSAEKVEQGTPQETAPTEDAIEDAEDSVVGEVADQTEPQNSATKGDVKNA
jgi:hypothetical protein